MKAERDCLDPAKRSMAVRTSPESVIEVFSFILRLYHHTWDYFWNGAVVFIVRLLSRLPPFRRERGKGWGTLFMCDLDLRQE
jgi:hypothetical protein